MSINALTNAAMSRRSHFKPIGRPPQNLGEIARAAGLVSLQTAAGTATTPATGDSASGANTTLQTLTTFIPTEVLTLYVAAVAALGPIKNAHGDNFGRWFPFFGFLIATPLLVWLAFATKIRLAVKPIPLSPKYWPMWEMFAATLAYASWVFALPDTPFVQFSNWYSQSLAGFLVLVVSYGFGVIAPIMQRELQSLAATLMQREHSPALV